MNFKKESSSDLCDIKGCGNNFLIITYIKFEDGFTHRKYLCRKHYWEYQRGNRPEEN